MTLYFVDTQGNYLGGFDGATPPDGSIEVDSPPNDARDKWDGSKWIPFVDTSPDVNGFITDVWFDPNLAPVRSQLIMWTPLLQQFLSHAEGVPLIKQAWSDVKTQLNQVSTSLAPIVEGYASNRHIPLV